MKLFPLKGIEVDMMYNIVVGTNPMEIRVIIISSSDPNLKELCELYYIDFNDIQNRFPYIKTFAFAKEYKLQVVEIANIRIAIAMLYYSTFYDISPETIPYFTRYADVKIGNRRIDENDFEMTLPCLYSQMSDTKSWRRASYVAFYLEVNNAQNKLAEVESYLRTNGSIANRLLSAFNFLYYILPQTDLSINIIILSSILEALLLDEDEETKKKKISVRTGCLVWDYKTVPNSELDDRQLLAKTIKYFYEMRSMIVHEGKHYITLDSSELMAINAARGAILLIINRFIDLKIGSTDDIKAVVERNRINDGLDNAFKYLD